ncbi:hypothetical protein DMN91_002969 [Ooceraea biroi]|uniref:Mos1 transposase HTH domain-containing protein n=1 Tax=Ooceraea biroi TaxID=2015173 RepID=A0A3L8DYI9_OOCBI|nr:hypothetical protein DMN91_002969 [Ooceraea biroi]
MQFAGAVFTVYADLTSTTMEKSKIRVIYEYEFRRGTTVSETARNINAVFGEGSTTKATVGNWFKTFRDGDFSLANEPRGRPKTKVDNDHLRAVVESDPSQNLSPTDYHFFRNLDNLLVGKLFNSQQAVETAFRDFIDSRTPGFYSRGIGQLPLKWQNSTQRSCITIVKLRATLYASAPITVIGTVSQRPQNRACRPEMGRSEFVPATRVRLNGTWLKFSNGIADPALDIAKFTWGFHRHSRTPAR